MKEKINLDEIIGDSKGQEAAKKIHEWFTKNCNYQYYKPDYKPEFKPIMVNCSDGKPSEKEKRAIEKAIREIKNG